MKLFHDSTSCLLRLLLLAELFVHSSSRPTHVPCNVFGTMMHQVDRLMSASKKIHGLTKDELTNFAGFEHRLDSLPRFQYTAAHFGSLKVNESLSQLHVYTQSFRLHLDWLKTTNENISFSQPLEDAGTHLLHLSKLINTSLHQIQAEVPQPPPSPPSLPVVSTAFDALRFSIELSERLQFFCDLSKRVLRQIQRHSRCPRR
ncbi:interleukin-11-like [Parambassis ranga]|uniref:Interleukin-11-like n=1 Tax=Parambassis ranga TaxID=210632 RepID=A0A6P7K390_9TELE|nr:interleukin-11 [Parambassis ranga]